MKESSLETLIKLLAKLPGLGPRSGRRAVLHLLKHRDLLLSPLLNSLEEVSEKIVFCENCRNLDDASPCKICSHPARDKTQLCIVEDVADLWALERTAYFKGLYHVLGGTLSAIDGIGPDQLHLPHMFKMIEKNNVTEIILALNATVEGQTTAHYIADRLKDCNVSITALAHGVPIGGELDYLDDGTLTTALNTRRSFGN